jgi:membrane fusion protein (multidrug efflux system)
VHNVTALEVQPTPFKVEIKLPCSTRPREVIELRAARQGRMAFLPFKEGDEVPASISPNEAEKLEQLRPVARIDDHELRIMLADRTTRLESAKRALKRVQDYADSTPEQLDRAQTALDLASSDVRMTEQMIRDTYITCPMAGTLTRRLRQKGEFVNQGELIGVVAVLRPMLVSVDIPEAHIGRVRKGDEFSVRFEALSMSRNARVTLVDKVAHEQTHTFRVEMEVDNGDLQVPAGVFASLMLVIYDKSAAVVIPLDAIKLEGGKKIVFVIAGGKAERREIEIGHFTGNSVEVTRGLKAGEQIAVLGARLLNEGDAVAIRSDPTGK